MHLTGVYVPDGASVCAMADKTSVPSNPHLTPDAQHNGKTNSKQQRKDSIFNKNL